MRNVCGGGETKGKAYINIKHNPLDVWRLGSIGSSVYGYVQWTSSRLSYLPQSCGTVDVYVIICVAIWHMFSIFREWFQSSSTCTRVNRGMGNHLIGKMEATHVNQSNHSHSTIISIWASTEHLQTKATLFINHDQTARGTDYLLLIFRCLYGPESRPHTQTHKFPFHASALSRWDCPSHVLIVYNTFIYVDGFI